MALSKYHASAIASYARLADRAEDANNFKVFIDARPSLKNQTVKPLYFFKFKNSKLMELSS